MQNTVNIQDIIPPEDVSFWPPQPGWYLVLGVFCILILIAIIQYRLHKKRNAFRAVALARLEEIDKQGSIDSNFGQINKLLKACALKSYPRNQVASLIGKEWIDFLNKTSVSAEFKTKYGVLTSNGQYKKSNKNAISKEEYHEFLLACRNWIRTHKLYKI